MNFTAFLRGSVLTSKSILHLPYYKHSLSTRGWMEEAECGVRSAEYGK